VEDINIDVIAVETLVRAWFYEGQWKTWKELNSPVTLKKFIDGFLKKHGFSDYI